MMLRRALVVAFMFAGCGRLYFDPRGDAMADTSAPDLGGSARYVDVVMAAGPRAYYRLGEATAGPAVDATGNGNDGIYDSMMGGTLTFGLAGALTDPHPAVRMTGDGNLGPTDAAYVQIPTTVIDWSGDFTVELFLEPTAAPMPGNNNATFICESYLNSGFRAGWNASSAPKMWTTEAGGTGDVTSSGTLAYGRFNHLVLVRSGTTLIGYHDGATMFTEPGFDYIPVTADAACGFGAMHGMPSYGIFDEVAIYDRALSPAEVTAHVNAR